ncbi:MAG: hypothetical protein JSV92_02340 [archaeon]|nr:MAG: hypothetical protein JSV92_02340 [archaeon]
MSSDRRNKVKDLQSKIEKCVKTEKIQPKKLKKIKKNILYLQSRSVYDNPLGILKGEKIKIIKIRPCYINSLVENKKILAEELRDKDLLENSEHPLVNINHMENIFNEHHSENHSENFINYYLQKDLYNNIYLKPCIATVFEKKVFRGEIKNKKKDGWQPIEIELCYTCFFGGKKKKFYNGTEVFYNPKHGPKIIEISKRIAPIYNKLSEV